MVTPGVVVGGAATERFIATALAAQGVRRIEIGFYNTARYPPFYTGPSARKTGRGRIYLNPDPPAASTVAAWQEFGVQGQIPERPFMRQTVAKLRASGTLRELVRSRLDPKTMIITPGTAELLGETVKGRMQRQLTTLRDPPNAPATISRKQSSNPLLDTGFLRQAVTYRVFYRPEGIT